MYRIYSYISWSTYKLTPSLDIKNVQILTPVYKSMLGRDLYLRVAGCDIRTGRVGVAEYPEVCRQCQDAAMATRDNAVEASRWAVHGRWQRADAAGEERHSLPVGVGASVADLVTSTVTIIDPFWWHLASISQWLSAIDLHRQPWKSCWPNDDACISRGPGFWS